MILEIIISKGCGCPKNHELNKNINNSISNQNFSNHNLRTKELQSLRTKELQNFRTKELQNLRTLKLNKNF